MITIKKMSLSKNNSPMKKSHKFFRSFVIVLLALPISQCSLFEQDIDGELSTSIPVNETQQGKDLQYSNSMVLSADSDQDIKDNLDKVKDWSVKEVSYSIMGFQGNASITFSGSLGFSRRSDSSPSITASVSNLMFSDVNNNGKKYKINLSETQLAKIAAFLDADQALKVYWNGVLSEGPMSCSVIVYAKVKITAKIL